MQDTADGLVENLGVVPPSKRFHQTNPGHAGFNDLDFVPYNWGTNRSGNRGGALIGHPISWEVVGPTMKSPFVHWQWAVDPVVNTLTLEAGPTSVLWGGGVVPTPDQAYNLGPSDPPGGLYVMVTMTGTEFVSNPPVSEVFVPPANGCAPLPLPGNVGAAQFELFRVTKRVGQTLFLDTGKLLSSFFDTSLPNPKIKAITLIRPKVTRLAAFPLQTAGTASNQVFVFVPPERAATSEYMPPYDGNAAGPPPAGCPSWINGLFDPLLAIPPGEASQYGTPNNLPVPIPKYTITATGPAVFVPQANLWGVTSVLSQVLTAGQVVRVRTLVNNTLTAPDTTRLLGWYEVQTTVGPGASTIVLRRVPEVDSETGNVTFGNGIALGAGDVVGIDVFDPISTLFTDPVLSIPKLVASRLDHLIDPQVMEKSYRGSLVGTPNAQYSDTPGGPAIFSTVDGSDPGNLSNLGFRAVFFPAMDDGLGNLIPDFNRPITGRNVLLDPTIPRNQQYLEVDYNAGVLYLSHPPKVGSDVAPHGIIVDPVQNPRNEIVLFAACVPYSREESQRGPGIQVKTTRLAGEFGSNDTADVYGGRTVLTPDPIMYGPLASGIITFLPPSENPPMTGWFQFAELDADPGVPGVFPKFVSLSQPCYYYRYEPSVSGFQGIALGSGVFPYTITPRTRILLMKNAVYPKVRTDSDAVRGASKRTPYLNFRATRTSLMSDGSITVSPVATLDDAYRANDPTTPGYGRQITVDGGAVEMIPTPSAGGDNIQAAVRVTASNVSGVASESSLNNVGFDFVGRADPLFATDPYAGYLDRRTLTFTGAGLTRIDNTGAVATVLGDVLTVNAPNYLWTLVGTSKRTLLMPGFDQVVINGKTYLLSDYGTNPTDFKVVNLDFTSPAFPFANVKVDFYRPKFLTGRGASGNINLNSHTWIAGAKYGGTPGFQPFGALNLYAGSAVTQGFGDDGGTVAALAFWSRVAIASPGGIPGAGPEVLFSSATFDVRGRYISVLNPDFMQNAGKIDYDIRGDSVTDVIKGLYSPIGPVYTPTTITQPTYGHIVEDYTYLLYRYDNLSMFPLVPSLAFPTPGALEFSGTTTANTILDGEITTALFDPWVPFGATIMEVLSVGGDPAIRGFYQVRATDNPGGHIYVAQMNGNTPTAVQFPGGAGVTVIFRLHYANVIGKQYGNLYRLVDATGTGIPASQTATQVIGSGIDPDAVGVVFSGASRFDTVFTSADRHAYRVTSSFNVVPGSGSLPSNKEVAALDNDGYHKAREYLFITPRLRDRAVNALSGQPTSSVGGSWTWNDLTATWQGTGDSQRLKFPLLIPESADRVTGAGVPTHRCRFVLVQVAGNYTGGVPSGAKLRVYRVTINSFAPPTVTPLWLGPAAATQTFDLTSTGSDVNNLVEVWTNNAAIPANYVYVDDTANDYYYAEIISGSAGNGVTSFVNGVSVRYTDPGPSTR